MTKQVSRRDMLAQAGLVAGAGWMLQTQRATAEAPTTSPHVRYCLNTSTIRGHELSVEQEIDAIAAAGYDSVELWMREISQFQESGGNLADLKRRLDDKGITLENAIGFANWIVDDDETRAKGLETLKRDMEAVRALGGSRIAAPPSGGTNDSLNLDRVAERFRAALKVGDDEGVQPQLELWGFSKTLSRLGELMYVAMESGDRDAKLLLDVYHIYKGGSDFQSLELINGSAVEILHMNDYPNIPIDKIRDEDRVYPGHGVAPISMILKTLFSSGFSGVLSLELFNKGYWKQDVSAVLRNGLQAMKSSVASTR